MRGEGGEREGESGRERRSGRREGVRGGGNGGMDVTATHAQTGVTCVSSVSPLPSSLLHLFPFSSPSLPPPPSSSSSLLPHSDWYESDAVMMCEEGSVIAGLLMGLNAIDYNVMMKGEDFDKSVSY